MNAEQRKVIAELIDQLSVIMDKIEMIKDDEESKYDNLPESIQNSEKGDKFQENIDTLDEAYNNVYYAIDSLNEVE